MRQGGPIHGGGGGGGGCGGTCGGDDGGDGVAEIVIGVVVDEFWVAGKDELLFALPSHFPANPPAHNLLSLYLSPPCEELGWGFSGFWGERGSTSMEEQRGHSCVMAIVY